MMFRSLCVRLLLPMLVLLPSLTGCNPGSEGARSNGNTSNTAPSNVASPTAPSPAATATPSAATAGKTKVNLNTTPEKDFLVAVPNLGDRMAHEFVEYRPYRSIQQFRREIGKYVKPDQVAEYEKYVYVPIAINEADAATLQQIPGLDADEAAAVIAGRPYASTDAFLSKLAGYVAEADLAVARSYVATP